MNTVRIIIQLILLSIPGNKSMPVQDIWLHIYVSARYDRNVIIGLKCTLIGGDGDG